MMLVGLEIHFHSGSWCLIPVEMGNLALFPNSPPFCAQLSSMCAARVASASFTFPAVFYIVRTQGFDPQEETFSPKSVCNFHIHQVLCHICTLISRSLGQGSYLEIFCHL